MRLLNFLSGIAPVLVCLAAPDDAAGGSSSQSSATAAPQPPEPTGSTLEEKFTSAKTIIADFFKQLGGAMKERDDAQAALATAKSETARVQGLYDTAVAENTRLTGQVTRLTSELSTATTSLATEKTHVANLESHCGVLGIDAKQAIKAPKQSADGNKTPSAIKQEYAALRKKEDAGEVARGSSSKFYRKHRKELDADE